MFIVRLLSLVLEVVAIVGLFVDIPIISSYAFWIMVAAYLLWVGQTFEGRKRVRWQLMLSIVLTMAAIVGLFVGIPIVSDYVFWVMTSAYLTFVASTDLYRSAG
jgi:hypothetical protein